MHRRVEGVVVEGPGSIADVPALTRLEVPVVWALDAQTAADGSWRASGIDRFLRWRDDPHREPGWRRWLGPGRDVAGGPIAAYTEMCGLLLAFHPDGLALVVESVGSTLVLIPVDALRVRP